MDREIVIAGAVRTPIGRFGGSLASVSAVDLGIAETCTREFVAQFVLVGFGFVFGVDVGLKEIHEYVENILFHAWSGSLRCPIQIVLRE